MTPLVDYPDSETDGEEILVKEKIKRRCVSVKERDARPSPIAASDLPPLPSSFHDLYTSATRASTLDDPSLHGGRKRAVPHIEGNWSTHVYLEWFPTSAQHELFASILARFEDDGSSAQTKLHSLVKSDLGAQLPLHVSLSRPIVLVTEQRQAFAEAFESSISKSGIRPFEVTPTKLDWVSNNENTRWFLVLRLKKPADDTLNRLLHLSNRCAHSFGQPALYAHASDYTSGGTVRSDPVSTRGRGRGARATSGSARKPREAIVHSGRDLSECFHVSIAWTLQRPSEVTMSRLVSVSGSAELGEAVKNLVVRFASVKLKIGNTVTNVPFKVHAEEGKGLIAG